MSFRFSFCGVALVAALALAPARADDLDAGRAVFARCKVCHRVGEGAKNSVGPELNGLTGRKAASRARSALITVAIFG